MTDEEVRKVIVGLRTAPREGMSAPYSVVQEIATERILALLPKISEVIESLLQDRARLAAELETTRAESSRWQAMIASALGRSLGNPTDDTLEKPVEYRLSAPGIPPDTGKVTGSIPVAPTTKCP